MAAGVNIAKTNLAIASHPPSRVVFSKTNIAIASSGDAPPPPAPRRRPLFVS